VALGKVEYRSGLGGVQMKRVLWVVLFPLLVVVGLLWVACVCFEEILSPSEDTIP
jgi:hypothetical protein